MKNNFIKFLLTLILCFNINDYVKSEELIFKSDTVELKNNGNIIRVTDLFKNYKLKKRKNINPVGFVIGNTNLYLTNTDGKMIVVDISLGDIKKIEKISGDFISRPFIFNQNLFVIRNGSIIQYN